jgi:glycosyltransferase involved in cell wall biosynthesis
MKVLFATYPMAFHTPGGGEIQLLAYRKHLSRYGVDVTLFDPWAPGFMDHDIVHFFSCVGGSVHFCNFVKQLGLPLVISSSLWITEQTKHLYPIDEIYAQLALADRIVANSDIECDTLSVVLGLPREKFSTVYNGVESFFFEATDPGLFRGHFKIYDRFILNVGNVEPRKNQLRLVRAMKALPDRRLVLIGHARSPEYLEQVYSEGGKQVTYLGPLDHDSPLLRSAYKACELFVLPSTLETPGLAALEALGQNARLVVTNEGSCAEYFGDRATYIDPMSVDSIQQGIRQALERPHLPDGGSRDETYSWANVVKRLDDVYRSVFATASSRDEVIQE